MNNDFFTDGLALTLLRELHAHATQSINTIGGSISPAHYSTIQTQQQTLERLLHSANSAAFEDYFTHNGKVANALRNRARQDDILATLNCASTDPYDPEHEIVRPGHLEIAMIRQIIGAYPKYRWENKKTYADLRALLDRVFPRYDSQFVNVFRTLHKEKLRRTYRHHGGTYELTVEHILPFRDNGALLGGSSRIVFKFTKSSGSSTSCTLNIDADGMTRGALNYVNTLEDKSYTPTRDATRDYFDHGLADVIPDWGVDVFFEMFEQIIDEFTEDTPVPDEMSEAQFIQAVKDLQRATPVPIGYGKEIDPGVWIDSREHYPAMYFEHYQVGYALPLIMLRFYPGRDRTADWPYLVQLQARTILSADGLLRLDYAVRISLMRSRFHQPHDPASVVTPATYAEIFKTLKNAREIFMRQHARHHQYYQLDMDETARINKDAE